MSPLTKVWSLIVVLAAAAIVPRGAFAQTSNATCVSGFDWMNNTLQQNPCTVAAYLESVCWGGDFSIYPLPAGTHYAAPEVTEANACECSTVVYSLISACGDCQNRTFLSWSLWSYNCSAAGTQLSVTTYPYNIPSGTLVPNWAYLNVTSGSGTFDATLAQADGDSPESSATTAQSTGTATHSTTVSGSLTTPPTTATGSSATSSSSSSSSNVGAIAGGVIGGVVGLAAIVGLAAWFFVKRRRSSKAPSAAFSDIGGGPGYTQSVYSANPHPFPMQSQMTQQPRLYDPADPTTFPTSPPSPTVLTTSSNIYQNPSIPSHVFSQQSRPGQYTGTPEI